MKKNAYVFILALLTVSCFYSLNSNVSKLPQEELLNQAYQMNSKKLLEQFFSNWQQNIRPISEQEFSSLSEIERAVYEIFEEFYDPRHLYRLGGSRRDNKLYRKCPYFIVQNKIYYRLAEEPGIQHFIGLRSKEEIENFYATRKQITNFRPRLHFSARKLVYLTEPYVIMLNSFLGKDFLQLDHCYVARGESLRRQQFLKKKAYIISGHWGNSWHIVTHPAVDFIEIDNNLEKAYVEYRIEFGGACAKFEKGSKGWKMVEAMGTWIE